MKNIATGSIIFCFVQTLFTVSCYGTEDLKSTYGDEELVSIATGMSQPVSKAPAVASVITARQIKSMGAIDLDDILETVPGLHVSVSPAGYNPIYTFRGIHTEFNPQVLILVNGISITNLFYGDRGQVWGGMPIEGISRIEIIRGPGSAIYGADAFAGVINIVTISPKELEGIEAGAKYGTNNTNNYWVLGAGSAGNLSYSASIETHTSDGQDRTVISDSQTFLDLISSTNASLAPGSVNLERDNIDARAVIELNDISLRLGAQTRRKGGNGAGIAQALDPFNQFSGDRLSADLTFRNIKISDYFVGELQFSVLNSTQEITKNLVLFPPGSTGPFFNLSGQPLFGIFPNGVIGNPELSESHYRTAFSGIYNGISNHQVTIGAGYNYGEIDQTKEEKNFGLNPYTGLPIDPAGPLVDVSDTNAVFLPEDNRENSYFFLQDAWHFADDWELTVGARFDHYSDFGDTFNPRLALVWSTRHNLTTKFLYGEAFRAPSFAETRVQSNPSFLGSSALEPETLKSYEIAFNYRPTFDLVFDLNLFHYEWDNIIHFVPDNSGATRTAQNTGRQTGNGLEFEAKWSATDTIDVIGNMAWQKSTDEDADKDAANSPEKQVYARVNWEFLPNYSANLQANWVMDRNRDYRDPRKAIDDYVLVDLTLRRTNLFGNFELALLAKNIFDEDAREPSPNGEPVPFIPDDLPLAGRSVLGEIRYKF